MDPKLIGPILIGAFFLWAIYRRVRRNIGRQPVSPNRMKLRMAMLALVTVLLAWPSVSDIELIGSLLAGIVGGVALAWYGLRETKFEVTPKGKFYTPHTYIGIFVSVLFIGRVIYRFIMVYPMMNAAHEAGANPFAAYQKSPMTLAIFGIVVGYYIAFYAGVLLKSEKLTLPPPTPGV